MMSSMMLNWLNSTTRCPRALSLDSSRSSTSILPADGGGRGGAPERSGAGGRVCGLSCACPGVSVYVWGCENGAQEVAA